MSVLIGDVNQDGAVTAEDVFLIRSHSLAAIDSSTFKYDVNADGRIDSSDVYVDRVSEINGDSLFPDFAFTGHYYHARSGLYLAPYRAYNPTIGRWLSRDPLKDAEVSQGPNLYLYVRNNPINLTDPDGRGILEFILKQIAKQIANKTSDQSNLGGPFIQPTSWQLIAEEKTTTTVCTCQKACIYFSWSGHYQDQLGSPQAAVLWIECNEPCPSQPIPRYRGSQL